MLSYIIFVMCLFIPLVVLLFKILIYFCFKFLFKAETKDYKFLRVHMLIFLTIAVIILSLASITPYLRQEHDKYLILYHNKNITLLNNYINEYSESAKKQIEEYQKLQAEMMRTATSIQLQYWSKQVDDIGVAITNRIKEFKDEIMEEEIFINEAEARIAIRPLNKWFFWVES